ncbi:hypothetical protein N7478_004355 [Penicillium angulare]|uniref:uncharacterized protein n=1 Tax=Penicillium angulare TaxID=116970 RepID=UPI002540C483|nr:uncharacterized protein N7478_004355 [Penicillium angulare]KAJ5278983.1 hypothetical protein N7478_004355 [Penicillium angulare]
MQGLKRKRVILACQPCRERKRKCEGGDPCATCREWGYQCYYPTRQRKSQTAQPSPSNEQSQPLSSPKSIQDDGLMESDQSGLVRRLEANSGAAFVRKLGLKIDPAKAPKLNLFGWNIGTRKLSSFVAKIDISINEITSLAHMRELAQFYFDKVDPCYGFIDRRVFYARLDARRQPALSPINMYDPSMDIYDSVLAGVAAIGCLFSSLPATPTEVQLVRMARYCLERYHLAGPPSVDLLTGWTLRTIYLRLTDTPHTTWIASSTLMHLLEASGFHPAPSEYSILPHSDDCDPEIKKRLVGVAHHLNIWTSFDLGLSRVSFQKSDLPDIPLSKPGDYTDEILGLLPVSVSLDPGGLKDEVDLTLTLPKLLDRTHTEPPSVLAQCNLVLCVLRRIHTQNLDISSNLAERVLKLLKKGLDCASKMVSNCSPWHQVANVPFQIICVLLTLDTRSSLAMLPEAMKTLSLVASIYDTHALAEAYSTACLLVMLHQQRRKDDIAILGESLNFRSGVHQTECRTPSQSEFQPSSEEYSWLGALVADLPGLQRVDLDQFLNADMMDTSSLWTGGV